jgi:glycosyltransferase involved in cell wall biosynthesis
VCVIAGDGSLRAVLEHAARQAGIEDNLLLVGNRPQRWLASLLADADVVLFPLAGRALVEATLSGSPLVVYDLEWHHEVLEDQVSGFLVESGDTTRMAQVAVEVIRHPDRTVPIAEAARQAALQRFDRSVLIAKERQLMKGLLKSGSMSPRVGNVDMGSGEQQETGHL